MFVSAAANRDSSAFPPDGDVSTLSASTVCIIWRSASASTSASVPPSPGWREGSHWRRCFAGSPTGRVDTDGARLEPAVVRGWATLPVRPRLTHRLKQHGGGAVVPVPVPQSTADVTGGSDARSEVGSRHPEGGA